MHLYHYAGNNPVKYTDPDGKVTQHTELEGKERLKQEAKDIYGLTFKYGLFGSFKFSLFQKIFNFEAEVNITASEITDDHYGFNNVDTAGLFIKVEAFGIISFTAGKKIETKGINSEKFLDHLMNTYKNGKPSNDLKGLINIKGPLAIKLDDKDNDVKVGVGGGACVGIDAWINVSEIYDFVKYFIKRDRRDE